MSLLLTQPPEQGDNFLPQKQNLEHLEEPAKFEHSLAINEGGRAQG